MITSDNKNGVKISTAIVVDDDYDVVDAFSEYLEIKGIRVLGKGYNGKEAVDLYKKLKPDVMTLDIIMPEVEGVDALKAIREITTEDPQARILMVSAMGQQETVVEAIQAGAKDFIVKPFQPSNVTSAVKRLLKR